MAVFTPVIPKMLPIRHKTMSDAPLQLLSLVISQELDEACYRSAVAFYSEDFLTLPGAGLKLFIRLNETYHKKKVPRKSIFTSL